MKRLLSVRLPVQIIKQANRYVAYTPVLDLSTSGRSEVEVRHRFGELVDIFFEELLEAGTLHEVLTDLGWKKINQNWQPPQIVSSESVSVEVPAMA